MLSTKLITFLHGKWRPLLYNSSNNFSTGQSSIEPTVTILNACTNIGRHLALILKQSPHIEELRLYDNQSIVCAIGEDLSHIDTKAQVKSFGGPLVMKDAITDADIVVSVGGTKSAPSETAQILFEKNCDDVRRTALHMIEYNPKGLFCIARPPVEALVPLVSEEYKKAGVYDARKIFGVTSTATMTVNSIVAKLAKEKPLEVLCPIVGGLSGECLVGVLSQTRPKGLPLQPIETQKLICRAEDDVINIYEDTGSICLAPALGISRFVNSLLRAIKGETDCVECSFIRQTGHIGNFLPYMTSIIRLGRHGVLSSHMPKITVEEGQRLQKAAVRIKEFINLGEKTANEVPIKKTLQFEPKYA